MMPKPIFFHHIQKTAGTSLHTMFRREYGPNAVSTKIYGQTCAEAIRQNPGKRAISGHFHTLPGIRVPQDFYSVTLLRDPAERYISHLFSAIETFDLPPPGDSPTARWWSMVIDREEKGLLSLRNWQVESLYRYALEDDRGVSDDVKLSAAIAALDQFTTVGPVESFQDVAYVIAFDCHWRAAHDIAYENATRSRPMIGDVPSDVVARIRALNAADIALWEYAHQRFQVSRRRVLREALGLRAQTPAVDGPQCAPEGDLVPSSLAAPSDQKRAEATPPPIPSGTRDVEFTSWSLETGSGDPTRVPTGGDVQLNFRIRTRLPSPDITIGIRIIDSTGEIVFGTNSHLLGFRLSAAAGGEFLSVWRFRCGLGPGTYSISAALHPGLSHDARCFHYLENALAFAVSPTNADRFEGRFDLRPDLSIETLSSLGQVIRDQLPERSACEPSFEPPTPPLEEFAATLVPSTYLTEMHMDQVALVKLEVTNRGRSVWHCTGANPVHVSYHWVSEDSTLVVFDGIRTALPHTVNPGQTATVLARVLAPAVEGACVLQWSLVQEEVAWFHDKDPTALCEMPIFLKR